MAKEKKEIEYPDAPSGYVMLYNYKEPFMEFKSELHGTGFGYEGVLLQDGDTKHVQCHLCGDWFEALGNHINKEHNINAREYKKLTGLSQTTALIGDAMREKLIMNGQERFKNLRPGGKHTEESKKKIAETLKDNNREKQNLRGTCPLQLIERLQKKASELGRCPTEREIGFIGTLLKTYGTFREACMVAGLEPLSRGQTLEQNTRGAAGRPKGVSKYDKKYFVDFVRNFYKDHNEFPKWKDFGHSTLYIVNKYRAIKNEVDIEALQGLGIKYEPAKLRPMEEDELLQMIRIFINTNERNPSSSDCRRGLIPAEHLYRSKFGSLKKAIKKLD